MDECILYFMSWKYWESEGNAEKAQMFKEALIEALEPEMIGQSLIDEHGKPY